MPPKVIKPSRKPKKTSRKPKKTSRKPKKTSRKPVKTSRKPKKTSRKPKKTSRKPVKKSRKPKKTSRKPVKKSRKPVKKSRKPVKKSRKPKKTSRRPKKAGRTIDEIPPEIVIGNRMKPGAFKQMLGSYDIQQLDLVNKQFHEQFNKTHLNNKMLKDIIKKSKNLKQRELSPPSGLSRHVKVPIDSFPENIQTKFNEFGFRSSWIYGTSDHTGNYHVIRVNLPWGERVTLRTNRDGTLTMYHASYNRR